MEFIQNFKLSRVDRTDQEKKNKDKEVKNREKRLNYENRESKKS